MSETLLAAVAQLFRSLRKKHNLTQRELAKRLGTSQASISKIESRKTEPSAALWLQFCEAMGVSPDLITGLSEVELGSQDPAKTADESQPPS